VGEPDSNPGMYCRCYLTYVWWALGPPFLTPIPQYLPPVSSTLQFDPPSSSLGYLEVGSAEHTPQLLISRHAPSPSMSLFPIAMISSYMPQRRVEEPAVVSCVHIVLLLTLPITEKTHARRGATRSFTTARRCPGARFI